MGTAQISTGTTYTGNPSPVEDTPEPGTTFLFENMESHQQIVTETPEDMQMLLAWITAQTGKSKDEFSQLELFQNVFELVGSNGFTKKLIINPGMSAKRDYKPSAELMNNVRAWASAFYDNSPPILTSNTSGFVGASINLASDTPKQIRSNSAAAYGYIGVGQQIYNDNYSNQVMPPLNIETIQDSKLRDLLVKLFGANPPNGFTLGHLNVLKMMNLAEGSGSMAAGNWTISETGDVLSSALAQEGTGFVPDSNLFELQSAKMQSHIDAALKFFDADGNWVSSNEKVTTLAISEIEKSYEGVYRAMSQSGMSAELPPGMTLPDDVVALMSKLGDKRGGYNAVDLNTVIALGFVQLDRNTNLVSLTPRGQTLLETLQPAQTPEAAPEDTADAGSEAFWHATNTIMNAHGGTGQQLIDQLEGEITGKDKTTDRKDGKFYGYIVCDEISKMLEGDAPMLNESSPHWEKAGLGHLTPEQRKEILAAIKVWANNREKLDTVSEFNGAEGKDGRVITQEEAKAWVARNAFNWIPDSTERARQMLSSGVVPAQEWKSYGMNSQEVAPHKKTVGDIIKKVLGRDINTMSQVEFDQALFILETTGFIKMPDPKSQIKLITPAAEPQAAPPAP